MKSPVLRISLLILMALTLTAYAQPPQEALPLISAGRYVEAQQILAPYIAQHPEDLGSCYWYGRALLGVGQRAAAEAQFRAILEKKPESLDTRLYLAQTLYELRQPEGARGQLQEILRRDPGNQAASRLLDAINHNLGVQGAEPPELEGGRVAFINGGLSVDPGDLNLDSYNVKDYTFSNAPTDWLITSGTWATTNRWMCQPQWSWYGGFANNEPAAIWTKEEFSGDVTVEAYMCFKMGTDVAGRPYKNPNDMCLTLCGDGANLDSGYSFILGADHNTATRIMRGDQVLAETHDPANLLPSWANGMPPTYQWHRHWWALRARKVGDLLQFFMDEHLLLEVHDPVPLQRGRIALWTYDNGIIVPRTRIYFQQVVRPRSEPAGEEAWIQPVTQIAARAVPVSTSSPAPVDNDFEYDLDGWHSLETNPPAGALLTLIPGGPHGSGHCLALINMNAGGHFGAMISQATLDARQYSRLAFDYRIPAQAKVNFFLACGGKWYEIVFTGLDSPAPSSSLLGKIPGVMADNQWHHAEFDLLGALQAARGAADKCQFSNLHIANFNPTGYLMAGFGGNPAGCTWYLDNFSLSAQLDRTPPRVVSVTPADGAKIGGGEIVLGLEPGARSGYDPRSLKLLVNGKEMAAGDPGVRLDCQAPAIHLDPALAGLTLQDGQELKVTVTALASRAGGALSGPASYTYHYASATDTAAPPAPQISLPEQDLVKADFEHDLGGMKVFGDEALTTVTLDPTTAASGSSSLRVSNLTTGGRFGVQLAPNAFDAGKYRFLSFDYNFPPGVLLDLGLSTGGSWQTIKLTDSDSSNVIYAVPGAVADGQWHHVELDLYSLLLRQNPRRPDYRIAQMVLADFNWLGNSKDAFYHLDNVRLASLQPARESLPVTWTTAALSGISALSYKLDSDPDGEAPEEGQPATEPLVLPTASSFDGYLHLRARDGAGQWSATTTRRLVVVSGHPTATVVAPAANAHAAPAAIRLALAGGGTAGIDPESLALSVAGVPYRVSQDALIYDATAGTLTWYPDRVEPKPPVFTDGQTVAVALTSARDFAGNAVADLPHWSWTMDYSKDKQGPVIAQVSSPSHPTFMSNTFEDGKTGAVAALKNADVQVVAGATAGEGKYLRVHKTAAEPLVLRLLQTPFALDRYPLVAFDYKCNSQTHVNLVVESGNRRFVWAFSGPTAGTVGQVPGVKLDDQWHHVVVRLPAGLQDQPAPPVATVTGVYLYEEQNGERLPVGGEFALDNLIVGASTSGPFIARWHASDPTGVKGYSCMLTQDSAALPPETIMDTLAEHRFDPVAPGLWFLRLRAQDGAGNWGPVYTYTFLSTGPG